MRLVLDTSVVVAALRSGAGASSELLRLCRRQRFTPVGSLAVSLEYRAVALRSEHIAASGMSPAEAAAFVDAVCAMMTVERRFWTYRPFLKDPDDEIVLEAALNGRAAAIVTFNQRDFAGVEQFGIRIAQPSEILREFCK